MGIMNRFNICCNMHMHGGKQLRVVLTYCWITFMYVVCACKYAAAVASLPAACQR